jgi:hypothetical protein
MLVKVCKKCGIEKSLEEFNKHPETKDGYLNQCKECKREYSNERKSQRNPEVIQKRELSEKQSKLLIVRMRFCVKCEQEKCLKEFHKNPAMKDGYVNECKRCSIESKNRRIVKKNPELIQKRELKEKQSKLFIIGMRFCIKCEQEKTLEDFSKRLGMKDGYFSICKSCEYIRQRKWIEDNYEVYRERCNNWRNARYHNDPQFNLECKVRNSFDRFYRLVVKENKDISNNDLGLTKEFILAIDAKIGPRPDGDYHLDHIIPLSAFRGKLDKEEYVLLAHDPENLRWLPGAENLSKQDSIHFDLIEANPRLSEIFQKLLDNQEEEV